MKTLIRDQPELALTVAFLLFALILFLGFASLAPAQGEPPSAKIMRDMAIAQANELHRIAVALERIAAALEKQDSVNTDPLRGWVSPPPPYDRRSVWPIYRGQNNRVDDSLVIGQDYTLPLPGRNRVIPPDTESSPVVKP